MQILRLGQIVKIRNATQIGPKTSTFKFLVKSLFLVKIGRDWCASETETALFFHCHKLTLEVTPG